MAAPRGVRGQGGRRALRLVLCAAVVLALARGSSGGAAFDDENAQLQSQAAAVRPPEVAKGGGGERAGRRGVPGSQDGAPGAEAAVTALQVAAATTAMAAASGLGAAPFVVWRHLPPSWAAIANAAACGVMLAASFELVREGEEGGALGAVAGMLLGVLFIRAAERVLRAHGEHVTFASFHGASARKALLMVGTMTLHAFGEGAGVGVSFSGRRGWTQGMLVTLAIGAHNIPEGLAVATVLAARGATPGSCAMWAFLSSLPQPLLAVPSFLFVETFEALLPVGTGFAAGCMLWIAFAELIPDALEHVPATRVATTVVLSATSLEAFRLVTCALESPQGVLAPPEAFADLPTLLVATAPSLVALAAAFAVGLTLPGELLVAPHVRASLAGVAAGAAAAAGAADVVTIASLRAGCIAAVGAGAFTLLAADARAERAAEAEASAPGEAAADCEAPREDDDGGKRARRAHGSISADVVARFACAAAFAAGVDGAAVLSGASRLGGGAGAAHVVLPGAFRALRAGAIMSIAVVSVHPGRTVLAAGAVAMLSHVLGALGAPSLIPRVALVDARAGAAGMLLGAGMGELLGSARRQAPGAAGRGFAFGLAASALVSGVTALMCAQTPYCLW